MKIKHLNKIAKRIILIVIIIISVLGILKCASIIGHNQYSSLEYYKFNISKPELVSEIFNFKKLNPKLNPPKDNPIFGDESYDMNGYDSPIYFYYPEKHSIIVTFVFNDKNKSSFAFYSIIDLCDTTANKYKEINFSFGCSENRKQLKLFEDRIVNPLRKQIRDKYKQKEQKK